jgi:hypothetical protein
MSALLVILDAALGSFLAGALFITFVVMGLLMLSVVVVCIYLLVPSVRQGLDRWMHRQEAGIWTDTLAYVDAEKVKYQRAHRTDPLWWTDGDAAREPVCRQGALYGQADPEDVPF